MKFLTAALLLLLSFKSLADARECYEYATNPYGAGLASAAAIELCSGGSRATVDCYTYAVSSYGGGLSSAGGLSLCAGPGTTRNVDCYKSSVNGISPMNPADALRLCRARASCLL